MWKGKTNRIVSLPRSRLVYWSEDGHSRAVAPGSPDRQAEALVDTTQGVYQPQTSPDGRWLAGVMGSNPNFHVFVFSLSGEPGRWQISRTPSVNPVWTADGKELIFEGLDGNVISVSVDTGTRFHAGTPRVLHRLGQSSLEASSISWAIDPTGQTFYEFVPPGRGQSGTIEVVTDFQSLVTRK